MAANITDNKETGKAEMMYVGQTPWHGLGTKLDKPATAEQAIKEAGLDWDVVSKPVFFKGEYDNSFSAISGKQAIVRADSGEVFNVMTKSYTPLQNRDAFGFFDKVVGEGQAIYHTAGSLAGGKRIWILAQLPGTLQVTKKDVLEKYVLLANSHDGSLAVHMKMTPIRVVCQNTLNIAINQGGKNSGFRSEHQGNIGQRVVEARELLGLSEAYFARVMEGVQALVKTPMNNNDLNHFLWEVYQLDPALPLSDQFHLKQMSYEQTLELFETGKGIQDDKEVRGTAWAAYNAVAEYIDHQKPVGQSEDTMGSRDVKVMDKRLDSAWFGAGAKVKSKAWELLTAGA